MSGELIPAAAVVGEVVLAEPAAALLAESTDNWLGSKQSKRTREDYERELRFYIAWCAGRMLDPLAARTRNANSYLNHRAKAAPAPKSQARTAAVLSSWYKHLISEEVAEFNPFAAAARRKDPKPIAPTRHLDPAETRSLITAAGTRTEGRRGGTDSCARDALAIKIVFRLGLRASEVCRLTVGSRTVQQGQPALVVKGKGQKSVTRALPADLNAEIDAHLAARASADGRSPGKAEPLLATRTGKPISRGYLHKKVKDAAVAARIANPEEVRTHSGRKTYAVQATRAGARLEDLQDSMMHSDPRTTRGYQAEALALDNDPAHLLGEIYK